MLLVKTVLRKSGKHGIGLFAGQFIRKGTVTWKYTPWFDISYSKEKIRKMSKVAKKQVLYYAYFDYKLKKFVLPSDDERFINHSANPKHINIESTPDRDTALRDIRPGEELLCDYHKFETTYFYRHKIDYSTLK
ncbi:MAG TPA: SET domain-containing protein [Candidatus Paceibacterota bacterium]